MKITASLVNVTLLYVETAPLIYYIEENAQYIDRMDRIFRLLQDTSTQAVSSVITLTEVLNRPLQLGRMDLVRAYRAILISNPSVHLRMIDLIIAERAAQLRAEYNLRTPDALHIATALIAGCDAFLTNDRALNRVTDIPMLILDELELDKAE